MGRRGGGKSAKRAAKAAAKSISKKNKAAAPAPPPPPPPPPIEEQIVTPPQISVNPDPIARTKKVLRIPDFSSDEEDYGSESPTFDEHPMGCRCGCCQEDY